MKTSFLHLLLALVLATSLANCTTAYDAYGRPQTVVTPEGAVLGAAAAGIIGYSIANNNNNRRYDRGRHRHYDRGYRRSYYHR